MQSKIVSSLQQEIKNIQVVYRFIVQLMSQLTQNRFLRANSLSHLASMRRGSHQPFLQHIYWPSQMQFSKPLNNHTALRFWGNTILQWFSFLCGSFQSVLLEGKRSNPRPLQCGIPKVLDLLPILFNIYMRPVGEIISWPRVCGIISMLMKLSLLANQAMLSGAGHVWIL